jgi:hypothetical protein
MKIKERKAKTCVMKEGTATTDPLQFTSEQY